MTDAAARIRSHPRADTSTDDRIWSFAMRIDGSRHLAAPLDKVGLAGSRSPAAGAAEPAASAPGTGYSFADSFERARPREHEAVALSPLRGITALFMNMFLVGSGAQDSMTGASPLADPKPPPGGYPTRLYKPRP